MTVVVASKQFEKQLKKIPKRIIEAVLVWIETVEELGIREARKLKGYHDEPLKGQRKGQRSVRMSRSYRVIYEEDQDKKTVTITVLEVNKHEY